jgi:O-antigen ligase
MAGAAVLVPLTSWLAPLGFAPLLALIGLLCLPALRIEDEDRPVVVVLLVALIWADVATIWSPFHPKDVGHSVVLQLALGMPLFWSAICGARRADPRLNALAIRIMAIGLALFGAELIAETLTNAGIYSWLCERYYHPMRIDLAQTNVAHSTYVLAVLWPAVLAGGMRRRWEVGLLALGVAGTVAAAHAFGADAPVLALPLASSVMLAVWLWPRVAPRLLAVVVAALSFTMPAIVWAVRETGHYGQLERDVQLSWSARMAYWSHTIDWIFQKPVRGWGLDASRTMPVITLHPHNGALQVWLELGLAGAVAASAFWALTLHRLSRRHPDLEMSGVAGSAAAFILFAWVNYGLWQQWWLALGALIAVIAAMLSNRDVAARSTRAPK